MNASDADRPAQIKPYYEEPGITIYHGDCRDILPHLPKVDLVLTDPPYGIGDKMQGGTWGAKEKYADFRKWDKQDPEAVKLALNSGAWLILWGGNYYSHLLFPSRCWLVWNKLNAVNTMADCELAWTNFDKPTKRFDWPVGVHSFGHPTQKPLELMSWCTQMGTFQTILDPFMGSGTTLRAAKDLGRKAIGIEIEEKYCEIAVKRLRQEVLPL